MTILLGVLLVVLGWVAGARGTLFLRVIAAALSIPISLVSFFFAQDHNAVLVAMAYVLGFNISLVAGAVARDMLPRRMPERNPEGEAVDVDP